LSLAVLLFTAVCCQFVIMFKCFEYYITVFVCVLGLFSWHPTLMTLSVTCILCILLYSIFCVYLHFQFILFLVLSIKIVKLDAYFKSRSCCIICII